MVRRLLALLPFVSVVALMTFYDYLTAPAFRAELPALAESTQNPEPADIAAPPLQLEVPAPKPEEAAPTPILVQRVPTPALSRTLNVLLVGLDRRPGQKYGGRPDTIVVAALSEKEGHLGLISVPRDLYVQIPDHGMDRINATYSVAARQKVSATLLLKRVLEDTLGFPISHTLSLDLGGFEELIDSIGGVEVDVPCAILDDFIDERTSSGRRVLDVDAGRQHLDGVTASLYVRSRHGRSDWSRARRQQAVLFGIQRRFASVQGIARLSDFFETLGPLVASDMSRADVLRLAQAASRLQPEHIHGLVLGVKQAAPHLTEDGKAVLVPNLEEIDRSLAELFASPSPGERPPLAACPRRDAALSTRRP